MTTTTVTTAPQAAVKAEKTVTSRIVRVVGWTLRILLAITFFNAAFQKLTAQPMIVAGFEGLGGEPMMYVVGVLELAGAVGLLVPILSGVASIGLAALLVIITAVTVGTVGPAMAGLPVACLIAAGVLVSLQRHQTVRIARFVRRTVTRR